MARERLVEEEIELLRQEVMALKEAKKAIMSMVGLQTEDQRSLLNAQRDGAILLIGTIEDVLGIAVERSALAKRRDEAILRKVKSA